LKEFLKLLHKGVDPTTLTSEEKNLLTKFSSFGAISQNKEFIKLEKGYKIGTIDLAKSTTGFLEPFDQSSQDILIESHNLLNAHRGDIAIVKLFPKKKRRQSGRVIYIIKRAQPTSLVYTTTTHQRVVARHIVTDLIITLQASQKSLKQLPEGTVLQIDNETQEILKVIGVLSDPKVDEYISLALYNRPEHFSKEAQSEAKAWGDTVDKSMYPHRVDLTHLPFCTIDPPDAKDFDDAIYFDIENTTLYVAIADVSEYVYAMGAIDKEAKERGFSIYFPHKSIPMLPRALSENICSLKPNVDRLAFAYKIKIDPNTLEVEDEELLEVVINSKKRYSYDRVDEFLEERFDNLDDADKWILKSLMPLSKLIFQVRQKRIENAAVFRSSDIRMVIDDEMELLSTKEENETASHSLIEDCMLLANKAAAKMIDVGVFRSHEYPSSARIASLLDELALVGILSAQYANPYDTIKNIQIKAKELGLEEEVDKLIIKAQKKAGYTTQNFGHFGLGFDRYTHFTSPIRRYSDLTLHRLLKCTLKEDDKLKNYLLGNIDDLNIKISNLERECAKVEWDFMDRKFARWFEKRMDREFRAIVVQTTEPAANIEDEIVGARILLEDRSVNLFDKVMIKITKVDIASAKVYGKIARVLDDN
jgi:ribonuclease R